MSRTLLIIQGQNKNYRHDEKEESLKIEQLRNVIIKFKVQGKVDIKTLHVCTKFELFM